MQSTMAVYEDFNDPTTYDIMKAYLADEEEDLYWDEEQVELISLIGKQNWLIKQM